MIPVRGIGGSFEADKRVGFPHIANQTQAPAPLESRPPTYVPGLGAGQYVSSSATLTFSGAQVSLLTPPVLGVR